MDINTTPNPITLKFMPQGFVTNNTGEFKDVKSEHSMLVNELLKTKGVKSVFLGKNFISVSRASDVEWEEIRHDVIDIINIYKDEIQASPGDIIENREGKIREYSATKNINGDIEIEEKIQEILDKKIRPAVAVDGGDIELVAFDKDLKTIYVSMKGACSGCPHSQATLKHGICATMKHYLAGAVEYVEEV